MEIILKSETVQPCLDDLSALHADNESACMTISQMYIIASVEEVTEKHSEKILKSICGNVGSEQYPIKHESDPNESITSSRDRQTKESTATTFSNYIESTFGNKYFYLLLVLNKERDDNSEETSKIVLFEISSQSQCPGSNPTHDGLYFKLTVLRNAKEASSIILVHRTQRKNNGHLLMKGTRLTSQSILFKTLVLKPITNTYHDVDTMQSMWCFGMKSNFENDLFVESLNSIVKLLEPALGKTTSNFAKKTEIVIRAQRVAPGAYAIVSSSLEGSNNNVNDDEESTDTKKKRENSIGDSVKSYIGNDPLGFYFVTPADKSTLTDYMFLVIAQVRRGILTPDDLTNARRKNPILQPGYLGLRCRHCGGTKRGQYFPTTCKNLQACPSMIYRHLMSCSECPQAMKEVIEIAKEKHKFQVNQNGVTQISFVNILWGRIRDPSFDGGNEESRKDVSSILQYFCRLSHASESPSSSGTITPINQLDVVQNCIIMEGNDNFSGKSPLHTPSPTIKKSPQPIIMNPDQLANEPKIQNEQKESPSKSLNTSVASLSSFDRSSLYQGPYVNSIYDTRSLNLTIDMLDEVALEILNSSQYCNNTLPPVQANLDIQWDQNSFYSLKEMIDEDEDFREMIDILARMDPIDGED